MTAEVRMRRIDQQLSHVWMVRTFLRHAEEAQDDDELSEVHRTLYDCMLALGRPFQLDDAESYIKLARKKLSKLKNATQLFVEIQPEVSDHTNFRMAARSLSAAVEEVEAILDA